MDKTFISREVGCSLSYVSDILNGKRNPKTKLGLKIIEAAGTEYARKCKKQYIDSIMNLYELRKSIDDMKVDLMNESKKYKQWH